MLATGMIYLAASLSPGDPLRASDSQRGSPGGYHEAASLSTQRRAVFKVEMPVQGHAEQLEVCSDPDGGSPTLIKPLEAWAHCENTNSCAMIHVPPPRDADGLSIL